MDKLRCRHALLAAPVNALAAIMQNELGGSSSQVATVQHHCTRRFLAAPARDSQDPPSFMTGMRESRINSNLCRLLGSCAKIESECIVLSGLAVCCCGIALFEIVICVVLGDGFRDVLLRVHVFGGCRFGVSFGMFCVWFG